ncbi:MAG: hypothetical protein MUO52_15100, partial [Desulfobacterales bacterium]|nr:hypothetical protein [Desulfobacterales bacterium]
TAAEPFEIQFLAGRSDSAEFALTHGLSTLINKHSKWLRAKVIETPGMLANYELVVKKPQMKANAIICGVTSGIQMFPKTKAEGGFSWGPYMDYRFVARMNETIHTFITLDPSIKSIKDLKGKRLADGRKVATRYLDNELIFKEAGIFDSIKITHGGTGSGINALRDGLVDAAVALGIGPVEPTTWMPLAPVQALMASKKTYFVSYDEEAFKSAMKKYGMGTSPVKFPAKSLGPDQAEPVVTKYDPLPLVVDKSMRDDAVYELLRIFDTYLRELDNFSATAKWIKREYLGTSGYETEKMYHPAAAKYFKEHQIPIRVNPW